MSDLGLQVLLDRSVCRSNPPAILEIHREVQPQITFLDRELAPFVAKATRLHRLVGDFDAYAWAQGQGIEITATLQTLQRLLVRCRALVRARSSNSVDVARHVEAAVQSWIAKIPCALLALPSEAEVEAARVALSVPKAKALGVEPRHAATAWENERWCAGPGWGKCMLPGDPRPWCMARSAGDLQPATAGAGVGPPSAADCGIAVEVSRTVQASPTMKSLPRKARSWSHRSPVSHPATMHEFSDKRHPLKRNVASRLVFCRCFADIFPPLRVRRSGLNLGVVHRRLLMLLGGCDCA